MKNLGARNAAQGTFLLPSSDAYNSKKQETLVSALLFQKNSQSRQDTFLKFLYVRNNN